MQSNVHFPPQVRWIQAIEGECHLTFSRKHIFSFNLFPRTVFFSKAKPISTLNPSQTFALASLLLVKSSDWKTPPKNMPCPCQIMTRIPKHEFLISPPKESNISGFSFQRCWPFTDWFSLQNRNDKLRYTIKSLPSSSTLALWRLDCCGKRYVSGSKRKIKLQTPHHPSAAFQSDSLITQKWVFWLLFLVGQYTLMFCKQQHWQDSFLAVSASLFVYVTLVPALCYATDARQLCFITKIALYFIPWSHGKLKKIFKIFKFNLWLPAH